MASSPTPTKYILGMDMGTTSVKVVLLDSHLRKVTDACSLPTTADSSNRNGNVMEQDPGKIIDTLNQCMTSLPRDKLRNVTKIGVSGQMHGVMFWKTKTACCWDQGDHGLMFRTKGVSQLITWQDGRCSSDFLSSLPKPDSHLNVTTGFGCATIFWYLQNRLEFLAEFTSAGTIHDYVVTMLCGLDRCLMSTQNAASWGYFNTSTNQWNLDILSSNGFPMELLPDPVAPGSCAGFTCSKWHGIPVGTPVGAALGDFQCAVYSCMVERTDAVLNISTSAQLSFAMPAEFQPPRVPDPSSPVSYFPYFDGVFLAVAASLNGGNAVATFVDMLTAWMKELGVEISSSSIYSQMIEAGLNQNSSDLKVRPTILGERHDTSCLGLVSNILASNVSLGHVTRALCQGIVENIATMLPPQLLLESGVKRIVGSGSALIRNEVLRQEAERAFPFPVQYSEDADSAVGVAMILSDRM
ncbi:sedoheptulokinase isoform X1 [Brienomyrus brachyistius]|uniref:sedoheptulokinase isoform X1 n=2 Tax=Brienomyrus brachyistius TaxID=42636 RepID=UPI0020B25CA6|nr:sedoheptulokinase isoform X1 [Brienomyrus brachyistius]